MSPRRQGDLGELSAMEWLGSQGFAVFFPIGHSPDCDLVVDDGCALQRVQVKTTTQLHKRRWVVTLCTRGGNRSWNGLVKHFSSSRCDSLFVLVADGRR
jgi:Holliday junction resolvase-like predicted endonuclease